MSKKLPTEPQGQIIVFGARQIRRIWHDNQWFFSVVDIVGALTDSTSPRKYWDAMKRREQEATGFQLSTLCRQLKLTSADVKYYVYKNVYKANCSDLGCLLILTIMGNAENIIRKVIEHVDTYPD